MTEDRTTYYGRATTWALDEQAAQRGSARRAWIIAGAAALIAVLEAFALLLLTPLKTVTMVPVLVDRQTGYVETLKPDGRREVAADQALTQSLLAQYVTARESFDIADVSAAYHKVALWSGEAARRDYLALMPASNPDSPLRRYPRTTHVETLVKSVSPLGPHAALVRFETRRLDQDGQAATPHAWAAVIGYRFSNEALSVSDRWLNPLGFQVVSYRRDAEAPLPLEPPAPAAAAPVVQPPVAVMPAAAVPAVAQPRAVATLPAGGGPAPAWTPR